MNLRKIDLNERCLIIKALSMLDGYFSVKVTLDVRTVSILKESVDELLSINLKLEVHEEYDDGRQYVEFLPGEHFKHDEVKDILLKPIGV